MSTPDSISLRRTLYHLHAVTISVPGGGQLGPIDWVLERGQRIRVRCATDAQWAALVALLSGERKPTAGALEEVLPVTVQTDERLRGGQSANRTLQELLESPDLPQQVWLEGRRRSVWVLLDTLGITPAMTRRAMKYLSPASQDKVWALRFLLSRATLVLGDAVIRIADADVERALRRCWSDHPAALVIRDHGEPLPGASHEWVQFDAAGRFASGPDLPAERAAPAATNDEG